jgi:hypothetical protein
VCWFRALAETIFCNRRQQRQRSFSALTESLLPSFSSVLKLSSFPRNTWLNFAQYTSERPEMISHGEKSKKAKNNKRKIKNEKIKHYIRYNSAAAWLLCVFAGGKSRSANRRFMA